MQSFCLGAPCGVYMCWILKVGWHVIVLVNWVPFIGAVLGCCWGYLGILAILSHMS